MAMTDIEVNEEVIISTGDTGRMVVEANPGLEALLRSRRLFTNVRWQDYASAGESDRDDVDDLSQAEAASSQRADDHSRHAIMFDIDLPARITMEDGLVVDKGDGHSFVWPFLAWNLGIRSWLIPSSTEGHSHLYVDCDLLWDDVLRILRQFERAGVVELGYLLASEKRGFTALRLPWIQKDGNCPICGNPGEHLGCHADLAHDQDGDR